MSLLSEYNKIAEFYDKNYKKLMIIPFVIILFSTSFLIFHKISSGDFFYKDISLRGGISVTFSVNQENKQLEENLVKILGTEDVNVRELRDAISQKIKGYEVQIGGDIDKETIFSALSEIMGFEINETNSSFGKQTALINSSFIWDNLVLLFIAFLFVTLVAFYYFKSVTPALTIIISTFMDIINILAVLTLFKIKIGIGSIGGLLMIIGFSSDSDILISTYILKRKGKMLDKIKKAFFTEFTMELAAYVTFTIMYLFSSIGIIKHIALILLIGTFSDAINSWLFSAAVQRLYVEGKKK